MLAERALERMEGVHGAEPLHGLHLRPVRLHREGKAGPRAVAVEEDGARAAHPVLAADVGAGEAEVLAQEVGEEAPGLDLALEGRAVHGDADGPPPAHAPPFGTACLASPVAAPSRLARRLLGLLPSDALARPPRGGLERPPGQHLDEMAPEVGRGMEVVVGLDRVAGGPRGGPYRLAVRRLAGEERLRGGDPKRRVVGAHDRETRFRDVPVRIGGQGRGGGGEGEVPGAPGDLLEAPAGAGGKERQLDANQHLRVPEGGGEGGAEELARRDPARPRGTADLHRRIEKKRHHRQLRRGVRVGEAAPEGPPVADREVGDVAHGRAKDREPFGDGRRDLELAVPGERPDPEPAGSLLDGGKARNAVHVDEERRMHEAEVQHRHEALPTREELRAAVVAGEERDRLVDALGSRVVEGRRLHGAGGFPGSGSGSDGGAGGPTDPIRTETVSGPQPPGPLAPAAFPGRSTDSVRQVSASNRAARDGDQVTRLATPMVPMIATLRAPRTPPRTHTLNRWMSSLVATCSILASIRARRSPKPELPSPPPEGAGRLGGGAGG